MEGGGRAGSGLLRGDKSLSSQRDLRNVLADQALVHLVAANIAEGHGRENTGSFIQFLRVAQGSLKELETHLILSGRIGLMSENAVKPLLKDADEIGRMLRSMVRSLQKRS